VLPIPVTAATPHPDCLHSCPPLLHPLPALAATAGRKMTVSERIRKGLVKPGSIYARFQELTPYKEPIEEQRAVWQVGARPSPPRCTIRSACVCPQRNCDTDLHTGRAVQAAQPELQSCDPVDV
jgi:hypothetical protein